MKGLKALKQLPVKKYITTAVKSANKVNSYYYSKEYYAYTASVTQTNYGEVLIVCLFATGEKSTDRRIRMPIIERHFLSETGEIAAEEYSSDFTAEAGEFTITISTAASFEKSTAIRDLTREWNSNYYISFENADEVIFKFADRHGLGKKLNNMYFCNSKEENNGYKSGLCWFAAYQTAYKSEKKCEAEVRRKQRTADRMAQIPDHPQEFEEWISEEHFSMTPWFYKFKKRIAEGICGGCGKMSTISGVKNCKKGSCPCCGRQIQYISIKNADGDCKYNFNTSLVERLSENEFICRYFSVTKAYRTQGFEVYKHLKLYETSRIIYRVKNNVLELVEKYSSHYSYRDDSSSWERIPPRYNAGDPGNTYTGNIIEITRELADLLEQPVLKNMDLRMLFKLGKNRNPMWVFTKAVKLPSLESMAKLGLTRLADDLIYWQDYDNLFENTKTGSPAKLLGVDRLVLKMFGNIDISLDQYLFWRKMKLSYTDFEDFRMLTANYTSQLSGIELICRDCPGIKFGTMVRYLEKQRKVWELTAYDAVNYWSDYLTMARQSGIDLENNRALIYPENVKKEHDRIMDLLEAFKSKELNEKLAFRVELLENLTFADDNFIISPLRNSDEFLNESNILNHCVKTYTERCANGNTNIFGLRKADNPDKPYFTVNISNKGELIQNRGKNNCDPPKDVKKFVDKWLKFVEKKLKTISLDPKAVLNKIQIKIGA